MLNSTLTKAPNVIISDNQAPMKVLNPYTYNQLQNILEMSKKTKQARTPRSGRLK